MAKKGSQVGLDEIGYWSEVKLAIVRKYAAAYSRILAARDFIKGHIYIDAFAGAGVHISRTTGKPIPGSPLNALLVQPPRGTAGRMQSIEIFFNFMIMDVNMNVLHRNPDKVSIAQQARMDAAWGDRSWRTVAYSSSEGKGTCWTFPFGGNSPSGYS